MGLMASHYAHRIRRRWLGRLPRPSGLSVLCRTYHASPDLQKVYGSHGLHHHFSRIHHRTSRQYLSTNLLSGCQGRNGRIILGRGTTR